MLLRSKCPSALVREDIQAALERACASSCFNHAPKLTRFLRFVVEMTLAGRGDRLKGYTIGVEALGRSEDFDPQTDPIVRVEAIRLRAALARYYSEAGCRDPVVIEMPRGGYVPRFVRRKLRARGAKARVDAAVRQVRRFLRIRLTWQMPADPN